MPHARAPVEAEAVRGHALGTSTPKVAGSAAAAAPLHTGPRSTAHRPLLIRRAPRRPANPTFVRPRRCWNAPGLAPTGTARRRGSRGSRAPASGMRWVAGRPPRAC
eukprot:scaffold3288_cov115-Isochrysis_galbana.AAC.3